MIDLPTILVDLSAKRPVFHSEADFQHALAWQLHEVLPDADVRLESQPVAGIHLDIWLWTNHGYIAIELKYATKLFSVDFHGESFNLAHHSAHPQRRYDAIKDVTRLERVVEHSPGATGHAVLLTNDSLYWTPSAQLNTVDATFRLHEGRTLKGVLAWSPHAGKNTIAGREEPFDLRGAYHLHWRDFSEVDRSAAGRFRYVVVSVSQQSQRD